MESATPAEKYVMIQTSLRIITCLLTSIAAFLMGLNQQNNNIMGFNMNVSIYADPTFKFFVIVNAIVAGYAAFTVIWLYSKMKKQYMHVLDLVILCLMVATASSTTAIGYLGKYGNNHIGWSSVCSYYQRFCTKTAISVAFSYISMLLLIPACTYWTKESNPNSGI